MNARRVTLRDIARLASVSVATVSRSLSGDPQIGATTRARVRQIADELGYVPNRAAQSLVRRHSMTFGLMTPDVTDPVHGQIVTGFQQRAAESGYSVILANGFSDPNAERRSLRVFTSHDVAGATFMGSVLPQDEVRDAAAPSPVLFLGSEHLSLAELGSDLPIGCLRADDRDGMRQVVDHLHDVGYRRVAYVSGPPAASQIIRLHSLTAALSARGLAAPTVYDAAGDEPSEFLTIARRISHDRPDVAVCYDDKIALNLMDALRTVGLDVPGDIGIVGFDDIPFARIANPRLTTVAQTAVELGQISAEMLLDALATGSLPPSRLLPVALLIRETTPGPHCS